VYLDVSHEMSHPESQVDREALLLEAKDHAIRILENQLREERDARRRADTIIAQLTQANAALAASVPELEAPSGVPGGPSTSAAALVTERVDNAPAPGGAMAEGAQPQSWWKRVFGG
jgi:hypothetical protein